MATVLYVDDEETIGRVVSRYFTRRHDVVHVAKSVAEAQEILKSADPTIVFLDVWLGGESGFDLLNWIEEYRPHLASRVTFVTGELSDIGRPGREWPPLGREVIHKPFDLKTLADAVQRAENDGGQ